VPAEQARALRAEIVVTNEPGQVAVYAPRGKLDTIARELRGMLGTVNMQIEQGRAQWLAAGLAHW